eukprot:gene22471-25459_t
MARRFRMWETSVAMQGQSTDSPTRSTAGNASFSNSFLATLLSVLCNSDNDN